MSLIRTCKARIWPNESGKGCDCTQERHPAREKRQSEQRTSCSLPCEGYKKVRALKACLQLVHKPLERLCPS